MVHLKFCHHPRKGKKELQSDADSAGEGKEETIINTMNNTGRKRANQMERDVPV